MGLLETWCFWLSIVPDCKSIFLYLSKPHRVYWFLFPASPQSYPFFGMTIRFAEREGGLLYLSDFSIFLFWAVDTEIRGGYGWNLSDLDRSAGQKPPEVLRIGIGLSSAVVPYVGWNWAFMFGLIYHFHFLPFNTRKIKNSFTYYSVCCLAQSSWSRNGFWPF